jgi:hypothetical protein
MTQSRPTEAANETEVANEKEAPDVTRLSVNINSDAVALLKAIARKRGITVTEAVRRAIGLLEFVDGVQDKDADLIVEENGERRHYVFLA